MSRPSWRSAAREALRRLRHRARPEHPRPPGPPRIALVGIGQDLRGDDAAGPLVARGIAARLHGAPHLLVLDAGPAPENHTGSLRRFLPDLVLLVDAARMAEPPGTIRWLAWQAMADVGASTHTLSPSLLATYLMGELGCEVALLGIQPRDTEFGAPVSPAVGEAVAEAVEALSQLLLAR